MNYSALLGSTATVCLCTVCVCVFVCVCVCVCAVAPDKDIVTSLDCTAREGIKLFALDGISWQ